MRNVGKILRLLPMLALLGASAFLVRPAGASDKQGIYTTLGDGNFSCGKWIQDRRFDSGSNVITASQQTVDLVAEKQWVDGFVSAYNRYIWESKDVASETDFDGMYAWIDTYCTAHPNEKITAATEQLIETLRIGPHPNSK